jgi:hypothetical protein
MRSSKKYSPRLNEVAVAAALCVVSAFASAATVVTSLSATGSHAIGTNPSVSLLDSISLPTPGARVDVAGYSGIGANNGFLHSWGSTAGNFGSRTSGGGVYDVSGSFKIVMTISNSTSVAQTARFDFQISPGVLANFIGSPLTGSNFVSAGMKFDVRRNGASLWGSEAALNSNSVGSSFNSSGDTSLYRRSSDAYYSVANVSKSIDLGVLNAGESIQLSYELNTFARGSSVAGVDRVVPETEYFVPDQWVDECTVAYGGDGYGAPCTFGKLKFIPGHTVKVPGYTLFGQVSGSQANSGDPFDVDFNGNVVSDPSLLRADASRFGASVTLTAVPVGAIPEPETYALMLGGLAVVGWMARRRRSLAA